MSNEHESDEGLESDLGAFLVRQRARMDEAKQRAHNAMCALPAVAALRTIPSKLASYGQAEADAEGYTESNTRTIAYLRGFAAALRLTRADLEETYTKATAAIAGDLAVASYIEELLVELAPVTQRATDGVCSGCGNEIDLDTCCCGGGDGDCDNHDFVPMGCRCREEPIDLKLSSVVMSARDVGAVEG